MRNFLGKLCLLMIAALFLSGCNPFRPNKAGLQVMTNDVASSVFLNGQYLEKTPYIAKDFKPGEYTLKIQPDDPKLIPHETTIHLRAGLLTVVTWKPGSRSESSGGVIYELEPITNRQRAEVSIISLPDGAIVSIDDRDKEFTPLLLEDLTPGNHQMVVTLPSYEGQNHTINLIKGFRLNVTVKLAKAGIDVAPTASDSGKSTTPTATVSGQRAASISAQVATGSARTATNSGTLTITKVTILKTNFFVSGKEVLRVRDQSSNAGKELGFATVGNSYPATGKTENGWYQIEFEGKLGWVSKQYARAE
jgi:uncharacterized protein YgiM (DUF1202 family)